MKQKIFLMLALTRKKYEKPTMQVVKLQQRTQLLAGSSVGATNSIDNWGDGGTTNDEIFM